MKKQAYALIATLILATAPAFSQGWNITMVGTLYQNADIHMVAIQGNYAFLAGGSNGFLVVDVTNPASMVEVANITSLGSVFNVLVSGESAYLECSGSTTWIVDISNPEEPHAVGSIGLVGHICVVEDALAYAIGGGWVRIYDVASPANPTLIGSFDTAADWTPDLDKQDNYLYAVCCWGAQEDWGGDALEIIDVSYPTTPVIVSQTEMFSRINEVEVEGDFAYFTALENAFQCWDISDPLHPRQLGSLNLTYGAYGLVLQGDFAYLTDCWPMGLRIEDVSDPENPIECGTYNTPDMSFGLDVVGDYAYVADNEYFEIYDCSDATHNEVAVSIVPFVQPIQIPASGGSFEFYLFADNSGPGTQAVDLWAKAIFPSGAVKSPVLGPTSASLASGTTSWIRHQSVPGNAPAGFYTYIVCAGNYPNAVWASDSLAFEKMTTGDGAWVGDWGEALSPNAPAQTPASFEQMGAFPNPFNPTTVASCELRVASHVSFKVYDTTGRLVATLMEGWREAGEHQVIFDGSGLPSGIYFYRVMAGSWSETGKMILLK